MLYFPRFFVTFTQILGNITQISRNKLPPPSNVLTTSIFLQETNHITDNLTADIEIHLT